MVIILYDDYIFKFKTLHKWRLFVCDIFEKLKVKYCNI